VKESEGKIILFIDEFHQLIGAGRSSGGGMDVANLIKPELARGELRCIAATTLDEYRKYIEKDAAFGTYTSPAGLVDGGTRQLTAAECTDVILRLFSSVTERRFQMCIVPEPSVEDTISILRGLKEKYELHHGVKLSDQALVVAVQLAQRYITGRFQPDKSIDLMDEACAMVRVQLDSQPEIIDTYNRRKVSNRHTTLPRHERESRCAIKLVRANKPNILSCMYSTDAT
jgi:ATP-dependent Clp protease ATP-binding subunit ClpB